MKALEEAQQIILAAVRPLPPETIPLPDAFGRVAAAALASPVHLPPADNSSVDGYAVRAADVASARKDAPVRLRLAGESPAGTPDAGTVEAGACVRIFTGSVLPRGADAVVMQEDVQPAPGDPRHILFLDKAAPWENVRFRGEDVKQGAILMEAGERFNVGRLGLLAAAGLIEVSVHGRPKVGLIATGSELREAGAALEPGAIFEGNRLALSVMAGQAGALPQIYPLVTDDLPATRRALEHAFTECDTVVTTGGVSVGAMDWVRTAFTEIGGQLEFWSIALKPGKPFAFGQRAGKLFFGLPGNPVSALVAFFLLVRPALQRMQGARDVSSASHPATLAEALANRGDRRHFVRVTVDAAGTVRSAGIQASHILSATARSNGLVDVPPNTTLPAGATVQVVRWD